MVLPRLARPFAVLIAALFLAPLLGASGAKAADAGEMSQGSPKAKVTVIEYASVTCPHCARVNNNVLPAFKAKYVDTGKVLYIFREFPTDPVQLSAAGFLVARCAPPAKYFAVIDALFHGQDKLYQSQDAKAWLYEAGKAGGLTEAQVQTCVQDKAGLEAFNARVDAAFNVAQIHATPTFVIGTTKLEGEKTLDDLSAAIDPLLAAK